MLESYFGQRNVALHQFADGTTAPLRFLDPVGEHLATRRAAGLFDFSFMACFEVVGPDSLPFLHHVQTRNLNLIDSGTVCYTLLLRDDGTVLIDTTVWVHANSRYWLFTGRRDDIGHLRQSAAGFDVTIDDLSQRNAVLALQGPLSHALLAPLVEPADLAALRYFHFTRAHVSGQPCWIGRLGYSGELGYEILAPAGVAVDVWERLIHAGAARGLRECGFEAADSLRIESGYILFSNELVERVTPYELGLSRLLSFGHAEFIGARALRAQRWKRPARVLAGLWLPSPDNALPAGMPNGPIDARVTSQTHSPLLQRQIGLGFVSAAKRFPGSRVIVDGNSSARVLRLPFYDPLRTIPRHAPR